MIALAVSSGGLIGASGYLLGVQSQRLHPLISGPTAIVSPTVSPAPTRGTDRMPIASSLSTPTARQDWRKYRNQAYSYSMEHPDTWIVGESYRSFPFRGWQVFHDLELGKGGSSGYAYGGPTVQLRVMSLGESNHGLARAMISASGDVVADGTIEVNGTVGEKWSAAEGRGGFGVFFVRNDRSYFLVVEGHDGTTDQVVASLRFE